MRCGRTAYWPTVSLSDCPFSWAGAASLRWSAWTHPGKCAAGRCACTVAFLEVALPRSGELVRMHLGKGAAARRVSTVWGLARHRSCGKVGPCRLTRASVPPVSCVVARRLGWRWRPRLHVTGRPSRTPAAPLGSNVVWHRPHCHEFQVHGLCWRPKNLRAALLVSLGRRRLTRAGWRALGLGANGRGWFVTAKRFGARI